jgi:hypothetical protein
LPPFAIVRDWPGRRGRGWERIGDQASTATSYAALGGLSEATGNLDEAVVYRVRSLAIRLQTGTATAGDVQPLAGLRRRLGRDRFRSSAVTSGLDEQSTVNLMEMLDQQEEAAGTDPRSPAPLNTLDRSPGLIEPAGMPLRALVQAEPPRWPLYNADVDVCHVEGIAVACRLMVVQTCSSQRELYSWEKRPAIAAVDAVDAGCDQEFGHK